MVDSILTYTEWFCCKIKYHLVSFIQSGENNNKFQNLIRIVGTPYTHNVHRVRLRPSTPTYQVEDMHLTIDDFKPDPS